MVFYQASESPLKQLCFGKQIRVCLLLSPVESFLSFGDLFVACWGPTQMSLENWTSSAPSTGLGWAIGPRPRDSCLPWAALQRGPTTTCLTCSSCGTSPGSCRYGWARHQPRQQHQTAHQPQSLLAKGRAAKAPLLRLCAVAQIINLLLLGWAELLKCLWELHSPHSCLQQQLLALLRADSTDEARSEQDSGLVWERQCWFQCFTPSGSPEDTPIFVPKFRLVVSVLYFSSAMMFLHELLWVKCAFQVFIPASHVLKLYVEGNIT